MNLWFKSFLAIFVFESSALSIAELNAGRSLAVTEIAIMAEFDLKDVLDQLLTQANDQQNTPLSLFQAWSLGHGCGGNETEIFNGFERPCRDSIAKDLDPFGEGVAGVIGGRYRALGAFNRFDLAPRGGAHYGEYRMVFARESGFFGGG